jgi:type II restriction/modification system DNA methylase subunit YeeA
VRVSLVCFGKNSHQPAQLDGAIVTKINPDLTSGSALSEAAKLAENRGCAFVATVKAGPFDIPGEIARGWLKLPNPNGRPSSDVLRPWSNGMDVTRRPSDTWIIDFGVDMPEADSMLYEMPFAHVQQAVLSQRTASTKETKYKRYWLLARPIPAMRTALAGLSRFIATPVVAKHRLFVWMDTRILADHQLIAIARADDATFGILHSRFHELWSLRLGTSLEDRPRYTPTTTFETFPFPEGLTPRDTAKQAGAASAPCMADEIVGANIAAAARRLNELRENWLNPPEWVERVPEVVPGFPDRIVPKPEHTAELKKRTLTNLYNQRVDGKAAWLDNAHKALDAAVAAAYGWADYTPEMPDEELLRRLLALNLARAADRET